MSLFEAYLKLGFNHILDPKAYDHVLFITALIAIYRPQQYKRLLVLVTAFTLGHSITLALATTGLLSVPRNLVEGLIPVTIALTCGYNLWLGVKESNVHFGLSYTFAAGFGLIHGLGFSGYLRMLLGQEQQLLEPLLAFNLGVEAGQLLVVSVLLALIWALHRFLSVPFRYWNLALSGLCGVLSLLLIYQNWFA